jgi:hypothetical protein
VIGLFLALSLCDNSGARVQAIYVYSGTNQLATNQAEILIDLVGMNQIFVDSAQKTGGYRHVRFVTDANCQPIIEALAVPSEKWTWPEMINTAEAAGFNRIDRKYLMFVDGSLPFCGVATISFDDTPGTGNANNSGPSFAAIKRGCWSDVIPAHELVHTLGAVQLMAPHSDGTAHCTDGFDLICSRGGGDNSVCGIEYQRLLDCGHDDYFNTQPAPGSYLDTHWNVANSIYLDKEYRTFIPYLIR